MTSGMKSAVAKRSVVISGHKTSVSLEDTFWHEVQALAKSRGMTVSHLLRHIDHDRQNANLSSAIRVYVLQHLRDQANMQQPAQNQTTQNQLQNQTQPQAQTQNGQWPSKNEIRTS